MKPQPTGHVAALNGRIVPLRDACVSIVDDGIVQGATVTERIRTFCHRPYLLAEHLSRLSQSLWLSRIADGSIIDGLPEIIQNVVSHNSRLLPGWQDLAIVIFATPGLNDALSAGVREAESPTICVHTVTIPAPGWAAAAESGVRLVTPSVRQIPTQSLDPQIKHRSRLHWFLAEQQARQIDPQAAALLLDSEGHVTETSSGNLIVFDGKQLCAPRAECVLGGISQQVVKDLAAAAGFEFVHRDLTPTEVIAAKEAFLTSTGYCLLPVTRLNGRSVGDGRPGRLGRQLLKDWSAEVGVDILAQQLQATMHEAS